MGRERGAHQESAATLMPGTNGGCPGGSTCADHDERIESLEARADQSDEVDGRIMAELADIRLILGRAPDPLAGHEGTGMAGVIYRLANHMMTGTPRSPMESVLDDESETTKVQGRSDLVKRSRSAEQKTKMALIGLAVTVTTTLGTIAVAWLTSG